MRRTLRTQFLRALQQRIDRYKPLLEHEFNVTLRDVEAKELQIGPWLSSVLSRSDHKLHAECIAKYGRPPTSMRRCLHSLEKRIIWVPAFILIYMHHWATGLHMKWQDDPPAVLVSFVGWSAADYDENTGKLDQWAVHELAHGVWTQLAQDADLDRNRRWRLWNEGFAHYLADIYMRKTYPREATINEKWSAFRQQGKQMIVEVVRRQGDDTLKDIPLRWSEFDALAIGKGQRT